MNFSLILPTLGEERLKRFLDSVERTAKYRNQVEVLLAIDEGSMSKFHWIVKDKYTFLVRIYQRPKTDNFSDDYYNYLANRSVGDNIYVCNDDIMLKTQNWDEKLLKKIDEHGWSIYLIDTLDTTRGKVNKDFCCFPIISRKAVNEIGFLFYPQVRVYPADKTIYGLYKKIGRVINAHDISVQSHYVSEDNNPRLWNIYQEDLKNGNLVVDITREVLILLMATKDDPGKKGKSKFKRIMEIIKEKQ